MDEDKAAKNRELVKEWKRKNPDKVKAQLKRYREKHIDKIRAYEHNRYKAMKEKADQYNEMQKRIEELEERIAIMSEERAEESEMDFPPKEEDIRHE